MAQTQTARITCRVCDGWYESDSDLRAHMQAAHRRFISAPIDRAAGDPQETGTETQDYATPKEPRN